MFAFLVQTSTASGSYHLLKPLSQMPIIILFVVEPFAGIRSVVSSSLDSRIRFVQGLVEEEETRRLKDKVREVEDALKDLREKTELTAEQYSLAGGIVEVLDQGDVAGETRSWFGRVCRPSRRF